MGRGKRYIRALQLKEKASGEGTAWAGFRTSLEIIDLFIIGDTHSHENSPRCESADMR